MLGSCLPLIQKTYILHNSFPAKILPTHLSHKGKAKGKSPLGSFNWFSCACCCGEWVSRELRVDEGGGRLASIYRELQKGNMENKQLVARQEAEVRKRKSGPCMPASWKDKCRLCPKWFLAFRGRGGGHMATMDILMRTQPWGRSCHTSWEGVGATYRTYCIARGNLLNSLWWCRWGKNWWRNGYTYIYNRFTLLDTRS